jgi:hypothetical protein
MKYTVLTLVVLIVPQNCKAIFKPGFGSGWCGVLNNLKLQVEEEVRFMKTVR